MPFNRYLVSDKRHDTPAITTGAAQQRHPMWPRAEHLHREALAADAQVEAELQFLEQGLLTAQQVSLLHHPVHLQFECFDGIEYFDTFFTTIDRAGYYASHDHLFELLDNFCPFETWIGLRVEATPDPDQVDWLPANYQELKTVYDRDLWHTYMLENHGDRLDEGWRLEDLCYDTLSVSVQEIFKEDMLGLGDPIRDVDIDTWRDIVPNRRWKVSIWRTPYSPQRGDSPSVSDALQER